MEDDKTKAIELARAGRWLVPPEQRPANWRSMGLKEQESAETAIAVIEAESVADPVAPTSVVANSPAELPDMRDPMIEWAVKKMKGADDEYADLELATIEAKKHKWKTSALAAAAKKALARYTFYDKMVIALKQGYMLFPPVPNADCIAIRVSEGAHPDFRYDDRPSGWNRPEREAETEALPAGEGEYKAPNVSWRICYKWKQGEKDMNRWRAADFEDPPFPVLMGKPRIIEATNAAMELKVFDEIRMFPLTRTKKGDPCFLGTIVDKRNNKRHYFLISWLINEADI